MNFHRRGFADPQTAMKDLKLSHSYATEQMDSSEGVRKWMWETERKRLAAISREIYDQIHGR